MRQSAMRKRSGTTKKHSRRWSAKVKTDSTHPPAGLFNKNAATIARTLASKKVSPKGAGSGMRMLTYFINRAGRNLSPTRRRELERPVVSGRAEIEARSALREPQGEPRVRRTTPRLPSSPLELDVPEFIPRR